MRKIAVSFLLLFGTIGINAQKQTIFKFYGQIRTDLFYNSRANEESVDGLFYLFPKNKAYDKKGDDLNSVASGGFYDLYSRAGVDVKGPKIWGAIPTAKLEIDFRGTGSSYSVLRLRHAYVNLDWGKNSLLLGQTWHPMYGDVAPKILNLNMGAPFQPFSRAPQIRYNYKFGNAKFIVASIWQSQYLSAGPAGKSQTYLKNSLIPELYLGVDYKTPKWLVGGGVEMISLVPRQQVQINNDDIYKVSERITSLSYEIHAKYSHEKLYVAGKSVLGSNLTHASMLGGYGIKSIDSRTGEQKYSPNRNSSSWINVAYGKKWQPAIFIGYMKNLGTTSTLISPTKEQKNMYGVGNNVDQLTSGSLELTYNIPNWKIGFEYNMTSAWYGDINNKGKVININSVTNNRFVGTLIFTF